MCVCVGRGWFVCVIVVGVKKNINTNPKKQLQRDKIIPNWTCNRLPVRVSVHTYIYIYIRVAKRVCIFCYRLAGSFVNITSTPTKSSSTFFSDFFSLSLDSTQFVFLYVMGFVCVCVCVFLLACLGYFFLFLLFFLVRSWMGTDWSIVGWGESGRRRRTNRTETDRERLSGYICQGARGHENREVPHREMSSTTNIYI